jgi:hypothetical protein
MAIRRMENREERKTNSGSPGRADEGESKDTEVGDRDN